ncbi:hypothetical protein [Amycolatopsis sp. SB7-3]|uniref:hypothetical protein n=1 Tax=Amycolatopsis sp. SB7-3 TaxID=3373438 RepID=UPI003743D2F5
MTTVFKVDFTSAATTPVVESKIYQAAATMLFAAMPSIPIPVILILPATRRRRSTFMRSHLNSFEPVKIRNLPRWQTLEWATRSS